MIIYSSYMLLSILCNELMIAYEGCLLKRVSYFYGVSSLICTLGIKVP